MNIDQLFDNALAVADRIANVNDMTGFDWFNLDMTRSLVEVEPGVKLAVMAREPGQKVTERQLWAFVPVAAERVAVAVAAERQAGLEQLTAKYAADTAFELEVDTFTFATGLAHAYRHHTGEVPTFLLDDDGSL